MPNKNIHIKDVVCDRNYRQGISVINAENLLIENCLLQLTDGTAPRAGIDFEPNLTNERLVNCVMRNCTTRWNGGCGYAIYIPTLDASSLPVSLRFENCRSLGDRGSAVAIYTGNSPAAAVKGSIVFEDCTFEGSGQPGIVVANKPVNGCRLRFDRCVLRDVAQAMPEHSPIVLQAHDSASEPVGGITFSDCRVREATERRLLSYSDLAGGAGVAELSGRLIVERGAKRTVVRLTEQRLAEWIPAARMKVIPRLGLEGVALQPLAAAKAADYSLAGIRLRQRAHLVLFARQGEMVRLTLSYRQVAHYSGRALPLVITGPSGGEVTRAEVPFQQQSEVTFPPRTGVWWPSTSASYLQVDRSSPALPQRGERPVRLYSSPMGSSSLPARGWRARVWRGLSEAVKATLLDPQGKLSAGGQPVGTTSSSRRPYLRLGMVPAPGATDQNLMEDPSWICGVPPLLASRATPPDQRLSRPAAGAWWGARLLPPAKTVAVRSAASALVLGGIARALDGDAARVAGALRLLLCLALLAVVVPQVARSPRRRGRRQEALGGWFLGIAVDQHAGRGRGRQGGVAPALRAAWAPVAGSSVNTRPAVNARPPSCYASSVRSSHRHARQAVGHWAPGLGLLPGLRLSPWLPAALPGLTTAVALWLRRELFVYLRRMVARASGRCGRR